MLDSDLNIQLNSDKKVITLYKDNVLVLADKDLPDKVFGYDNILRIEKSRKWNMLKMNDLFLYSEPYAKKISLQKNKPGMGRKLQIIEQPNCTSIMNQYKNCLTAGESSRDSGNELRSLTFEACDNTIDQCFDIIRPFKKENNKSNQNEAGNSTDSPESKNNKVPDNNKNVKQRDMGIQKEITTENKNSKFKFSPEGKKLSSDIELPGKPKRVKEILTDYDLKYVHEDLDNAHHFLAENDFDSVLIRKHFVPRCFYGYHSLKMYLNDPLPNLRKLKQKYCIYNHQHEKNL